MCPVCVGPVGQVCPVGCARWVCPLCLVGRPWLQNDLSMDFYAGRAPAASTATGAKAIHNYEQKVLVEEAFTK